MYKELLEKLFLLNMHRGMRLGLQNATELNKLIGSPDKSFNTVHVAGTNGKGSTATKIAAALQYSGYKVGLYTSPHLHCFRERIKINGKMISEEALSALLQKLFAISEAASLPTTFFDLTTCLAFKHFADENIDIAVIETGLGGRLDATNIITPLVSVITSISLDHTEILGNTIEEIAADKAGIIKKGVPVVTGPKIPYDVIAKVARQQNSAHCHVDGSFTYYDDENSAIAKKALNILQEHIEISDANIEKGLKERPQCRLQIFQGKELEHLPANLIPKAVILDVGHNPDGLQRLFTALTSLYPSTSKRVVCGLSKTKDIHTCLQIIKKYASHIHLVEADNGRGATKEQLAKILLEDLHMPPDTLYIDSLGCVEAMQSALRLGHVNNQIVIICGTFFIMNAAYRALQIDIPSDPFDTNERSATQFLQFIKK